MSTVRDRAELLTEVLQQSATGNEAGSAMALTDALDEMLAWLEDPRPYNGHRRSALLSIESDVRSSLRCSGTNVRALVEPLLKGFRMSDVIARAKRSEDLQPDRRMVQTAVDRASSDEGERASWQDVVASTKHADVALVRRRLAGFFRLIERRGIEFEHRDMTAAGVMQDRLRDVENAQHALGDEIAVHDRSPHDLPVGRAGLSFEARAELTGRVLCLDGRPAGYVVWFGIERASLTGMVLEVGSVRFFDARLIAEVLSEPIGERGDQMPPEILEDRWSRDWFPQDEFTLLARVDLGQRSGSFAARDARRRLVTLLAPSDRFYANDWRILPGHVVYRDGESVSHSAFENVEETPTHMRLEGVADSWLRDDARSVERVLSSSTSSETARLLGLYEWDVAHRNDDPLATVILAVRTIETTSQSFLGGMEWNELVRRYVPHFAWSRLRHALADEAWHVLHAYDRNPVETSRVRLRELFLDVTSQSRASTSPNLARFVDYLPEIRRLWADAGRDEMDDVLVRRLVRVSELDRCQATWTDADVFNRKLTEMSDGIENELDRLVRLRNAAQHGGPIPTPSIAGAVSLANHARGQILVDVLDELLKGNPADAVLNSMDQLDSERRRILEQTGTPIEALAAVVQK